MERAELQTMITVVDSPSFFETYQSSEEIFNRPDLCAEDFEDPDAIASNRKVRARWRKSLRVLNLGFSVEVQGQRVQDLEFRVECFRVWG